MSRDKEIKSDACVIAEMEIRVNAKKPSCLTGESHSGSYGIWGKKIFRDGISKRAQFTMNAYDLTLSREKFGSVILERISDSNKMETVLIFCGLL